MSVGQHLGDGFDPMKRDSWLVRGLTVLAVWVITGFAWLMGDK